MVGSRGSGRIVKGKGGDRRKDLTTMARVSELPSTTHSVQHGLSQDRSACRAVRVPGMGSSSMHEKTVLGVVQKWDKIDSLPLCLVRNSTKSYQRIFSAPPPAPSL